jgi:chemotaxis protein CheC
VKLNLQSINRAAAGNASGALKKLFKKDVALKIPVAKIVKVDKLKPAIELEAMTVGIYLPIGGDVKGAALLVIPIEAAFVLSDILFKRKQGSTRKLTRLDKAALKEVGNIICGQYFTVFSNMLGIKMVENIPSLSCSMFGAIISDIITRFVKMSDEALVVEINMVFKPRVLKVYFLLLFEPVKIMRLIK